jgi:hypothetical protein
MTVDVGAAIAFMAAHGRVLDRRRLARLVGDGSSEDVVAAVEGYRNDDGGYGWGIEPDLRSPESQPAGALHAFEVFEEVGPYTTTRATELCDWLDSVSRPDGGLPFALPVSDPAGCAPFWVGADTAASSLHITAAVVGLALGVARFDGGVRSHPWLRRATSYCFVQVRSGGHRPHALELRYALQFLDAAAETDAAAVVDLTRLGALIPSSGCLHVEGGLADETMRPLDFAPYPDRPVRRLFDAGIIAAELDRLADAQGDDGGWPSEWTSYSPAAALEWRGWLTVRALTILRKNSVI